MTYAPSAPAVLLGLNPADPYHRAMIEGVLAYRRSHEWWELLLVPDIDALRMHLADRDGVAGVIATDRRLDRQAWREAQVPGVVVLTPGPDPDLSSVTDDESAIATLSVRHLRECGLTRLAFLDHLAPPSDRRLAFAAEVSKAGLECHAYPPVGWQVRNGWHERTEAIGDWVQSLPRPIGVFCFRIEEAQQLAITCRRRGIRVPEEIAILSCGGDDIECHLASPPLSAIDQGGDRIGFEAARRLAELMDGGDPTPTFTRLQPIGITRRQSTDLLAVDDPHVAAAVRLIKEQACDGLTVREITRRLPVTRRQLDYAFRRTVGRSMHQQIMHERLERAKRLLIRTNLSLTDVAMQAGFSYSTRLSEAFRRELAMTPTDYRRRNQSVLVTP